MASKPNEAGDRMPPIPDEALTPAQRSAMQEIVAGRRGALIGPFIPALRSPAFMSRLQQLGEYLRFENALGPKLGELAILLTARHWSQQFEWFVHAPIAARQGLAAEVIDAIATGRRPEGLAADEAIVYDFFVELARTQSVTDETYARAVAAFGEAGVVDLVGIIGYYSTLAMLMNVARTPLPPGETPALPPLPTNG